jgi:hypothetical protein
LNQIHNWHELTRTHFHHHPSINFDST